MPDLTFTDAELDGLADLVADRVAARIGSGSTEPSAPAYTVPTLAAELGRTPRSILAAIARGELAAVKRGRGYVISGDAVTAWATAPGRNASRKGKPLRRAGLSREALRQAMR